MRQDAWSGGDRDGASKDAAGLPAAKPIATVPWPAGEVTRRKFCQFHANAVRVDDIGKDGLRAADGRLSDIGAPLPEHCGGGCHVLDVHAEMGDTGRPLRIGGLPWKSRLAMRRCRDVGKHGERTRDFD